MIKLASVFSDGALLQQNAVTEFRGVTEPGLTVKASLIRNNKTVRSVSAKAGADGRFVLRMPGEPGSFQPYRIRFQAGDSTLTLRDLLFGDVWIAAGQSNMEMRNNVIENHREVLEKAAGMCLRCYTYDLSALPEFEKGAYPAEPWDTAPGRWCSSSDPDAFALASAAATGALMRVYETLDRQGRAIPLGMLALNLGGSPIESWLPAETMESDPELKRLLCLTHHYTAPEDWNVRSAVGCNFFQQSALFNTIIGPALGMKAAGVLWYQGEANVSADRISETCYRRALIAYHRAYKERFAADPDRPFPVICSLLYPWIYGTDASVRMGYVNLGMVGAASDRPGEIAVVPIHDLPATWSYFYHYHPIHPTHKYAVGDRLGQLMLANVYGVGPMKTAAFCKRAIARGDRFELRFETFRQALTVNGDRLRGFWLCGKDGTYVPADARITGRSTVEVVSPLVPAPTGVCYQLADLETDGNLFCGGLPAAPMAGDGSSPLTVGPKPWTDAGTASCFCRLRGLETNVYSFPVRWPTEGTALCYDPAYHAVRLLAPDGSETCGMAVRATDTMPLDLGRYRALLFPVYGREETKISVRITFRGEDGQPETETCFPDVTPEGVNGILRCRLAFDPDKTGNAEQIEFRFDLTGTGYPTVAIGDFTLVPKNP